MIVHLMLLIKNYVILVIAVFFVQEIAAQKLKPIEQENVRQFFEDIYRRSRWEVSALAGVNAKARLTHSKEAKYKLSTAPQRCFEFGVMRNTNLQPNLGISLGLKFGLAGRNSAFIVPSSEIGYDSGEYPFNGPIARQLDISYFSLPAQLEYRIFKSKYDMYVLLGGISLRYAPLNSTSNGDMDVMEVRLEGNKKPFVNLNAGFGYGLVLKNQNILKFSIDINYDPSYIAKGKFFLRTASSYDEGSYTLKGNRTSLLVTYSMLGSKSTINRHIVE